MLKKSIALIGLALSILSVDTAWAHGEKAQMPQLRMRSVHWYDVEVSRTNLEVNDIVTVSGTFMPSKFWPEHVTSIEGTAFLNIGVPGPSFVRLDSRVNGVPMIRSTAFRKGEVYDFTVELKARKPGRYHVHPVINVKDTGPIIGPGLWVEVTGSAAAFRNTAVTLLGQEIDLETYGFGNALLWSGIWFALGLAWFVYWLLKCPIVISRFRRAAELGEDADEMITPRDRFVTAGFLMVTLALISGSYMYSNQRWPITTPLQTGKIHTPDAVREASPLSVKMLEARYRIPGRSFRMELEVANNGDSAVSVGEFAAGNLRFINSRVHKVTPKDEDDLVALDALHTEGGNVVLPGETRKLIIYADDALWETQRMTTMIASPDATVAGLLFFFDEQGNRYPVEVGGMMIPEFV